MNDYLRERFRKARAAAGKAVAPSVQESIEDRFARARQTAATQETAISTGSGGATFPSRGRLGANGNGGTGSSGAASPRAAHYSMQPDRREKGAASMSTEDRLFAEYLSYLDQSKAGVGKSAEELYKDYRKGVDDYYVAYDPVAAQKRVDELTAENHPSRANVVRTGRSRASAAEKEAARRERDAVVENNRAEAENLLNDIERANSVKADRDAEAAMQSLQEANPAAYQAVSRIADLSQKRQFVATETYRDTLKSAGYTDAQIRELVEQRTRLLNREAYEQKSKHLSDLAQSGFLGGAAATGIRIATGLPVGVAGGLDLTVQRLSGTPIDWYSPNLAAQRLEGDIVQAVAGELEQNTDWEIAGQNVAAFLYQTGISMTDSAAIAGMTALGVPAWLGTAALGTMAGTQAAIDAHERGASDRQAFNTGLMAGIAEAIFEKISLDTLLKPGAVNGATMGKRVMQTLRNLGVQAVTEGSEEVFTDLANGISDAWINGGQSEFQQNVRRYQLAGLNDEEAHRAAARDFAVQLGSSFAGGALSGGIMSAGTQAIRTGSANRKAERIYGQDAWALVDEALEIDPENGEAQRAKAKLKRGETLTGGELRRLVEQNDNAIATAAADLREDEKTAASDETTAVNDDPAEHIKNANTRLTENDLSDYLKTGKRMHARDQKQKQLNTGESPILTKISEVQNFIRDAFNGKKRDTVKAYGRVGSKFADDVLYATDGKTDLKGYYLELDSNAIAHIKKHVGADGDRRSIPLTEKQLLQIPDYIDNYDDLIDVISRKDGSVRLMLGKRINGHSIIIEAVSAGRQALHPVTAYQISSERYENEYKTKAVGRSSTSYRKEFDNVDISRPATAFINSIPQTGARSQGQMMTPAAMQDLDMIEQGHRRNGADDEAVKSLRTAFHVAYLYGTTGRLQEGDRADLRTMGLMDDEIDNAFAHGKAAANRQRMKGENRNGGQEQREVRVHDGSQRNGGADPGRSGKAVERSAAGESTGRAQRGGGADRGGTEGATGAGQSSARELIGAAGSENGSRVRTVSSAYSKSTADADAQARQRGLAAVFFTGGNLTLKDGGEARAYIDLEAGKVYVRADDPQYSADQIMRHELGHDAIRTGEIDPAEVYERLSERYGEAELGRIMELYGALYADANMSTDEIWEEIMCDSLGEMNAFSELGEVAELVNELLRDTRAEAQQSSKENIDTEGKKNADTGGKASIVRTSKMKLEEQIKEYQKGRMSSSDSFFFGNTPSCLKILGFDELPLVMNITDYGKSVKEKHSTKRRNILNLYKNLNTPVMAVGKPGNMAIIIDDVDGLAHPLLAAIHTGAMEDRAPANRITSIYGIDDVNRWIEGKLKSGAEFVVYNKNKADRLLSSFTHNGTLENKIRFAETMIADETGKSNTQNAEGKFSRVINPDTLEQVQQENEELRRQVKDFQRALRTAEKKLAGARESRDNWRNKATFRPERVGQEIIKAYEGTVAESEIHSQVKRLVDYAARKDGITYEQMKELAAPVAAQVVKSASAVVNGEEAQTWNDLKKYLRDGRIKVSKEVTLDIGEWGDFWRKNGRRLNLVTGMDGISVDTAYEELRDKFGRAYFPDEITHPADQLRRIAEVYDNLQPVFENPYSLNMAMAAEHCTNDLVDMVMKEVARGYKATYAGQLEEKVYQSREYTARLLAKERAHSEEQMQELKKHWQEQRAKEIEGRKDSELRQRLLNVARRLKNRKLPTVSRNLLNQYVDQMLNEAEREIFDKLDTESRSMRRSTREGLEWLRDQYEHLEETDPNFIPDAATVERIKRLSKRQIDSLTHQEVVELTYVLLNIENEIRNAKQLIDSAEKRDLHEAGVAVMRDVKNSPGSKASGISAAIDRLIVTETLSPLRQVRRMVGYVENDPLLIATRELADGQRKSFDYKRRAQARFQQFVDDKAFMESIAGKKAKTMTIQGIGEDGPTEVEITPAMKISLYLHSKNNQSLTHIAGGGIRVPDMAEYRRGKMAKAYNRGTVVKLEAGQVKKIAANLTAEERRFADAVFDYFNTMSKAEVNAVSEKLLGYPVAEVENYYPINTDDSFTKRDFESIKYDGSIEGMGFLKERIKSAEPIYLRDVTDVLMRSIEQHSRYVGLGIPVRNLNKLWGVTAKNYSDKNEQLASSSVQSTVKQQWDEEGYGYIEKMMSDLQTGRMEQDAYAKELNKIRSAYAGAVLTLNLSVAMKQAASYPTAAAVVGWKPLILAFKNVGKVDLNLIAAYTPLQWYRSQGYSTQELGDMAKRGIKLSPALNWIQGADLLTTRKLWKAAEIYVQEQQPALQRGTAEDIRTGKSPFYQAVAEVYNRIIEETQPNYTTMQRPQLLRSEDTLLQNLQMFKTQPFQNFNILYDAIGELQARERARQVAPTEENARAVREAKKRATWAVSSQAVQLLVFAGMTFLWNAFRGKRDKYEDEDGEVSVLSALKGIGLDMVSGLFSIIPFGGDAWELGTSVVTGGRYYGVTDVTTSALTDAGEELVQAGKTLSGLLTGSITDPNKVRLQMDGVFDAVSKAFGIPYENVLNMGKAVFRIGAKWIEGDYMGEYRYLQLTTDPDGSHKAEYYDLLYRAYKEDRTAHREIRQNMIESGYFDEDKIKNAMESRMKKEAGVDSVTKLNTRYVP